MPWLGGLFFALCGKHVYRQAAHFENHAQHVQPGTQTGGKHSSCMRRSSPRAGVTAGGAILYSVRRLRAAEAKVTKSGSDVRIRKY